MNKVAKRVLGLVIVLVLLYIILLPKFDVLRFWEEEQVSMVGGPSRGSQKLLVSGVIMTPSLLENNLSITGGIIANESIELRSEINGIADRIYFQEGKSVRKGQLLLKINVDELMAQLKKAQYTEKLRKETEFRQRQLLEREAISQEEYDQSLTELQTSQADIQLLQTQIDKSNIRAPFDGVVGLRSISEGAYVTSSTNIAPFYSINPVKVEFAIPGKYANRISVGSEVSFTTDVSDKDYTGKVYAVEPKIDPNTRTLKIRAKSPNPDGELIPGQFVKIDLQLERKENVLMVPTEAVVPELSSSKVFVLANGLVSEKKVETGMRTSTDLEIVSGLNPGDTVITTGILQIRQGMPVNVSL